MAVVEFLMKKLPNYCDKENVHLDTDLVARNNSIDIINVPSLLVNQFRWLNFVSDSLSIANQLLEMASIMQPTVSLALFIKC